MLKANARTGNAVAVLVLLTASITAMSVRADHAYADRCQPEELITGSGTSPIPEDSSPVCVVTDELLYPLVDCTSTLAECLMQVQQDPTGTATTVAANAPEIPTYLNNVATQLPPTTVDFIRFVASDPVGLTYQFYCLVVWGEDEPPRRI